MPDDSIISDEPVLSAVVILRPSGGGSLVEGGAITEATLEGSLPDPFAVAAAQHWFRGVGFEVSAPGAIDFSISAAPGRFAQVFGTALALQAEGGIVLDATTTTGVRELPLDGLPEEIRAVIEAVAFSEPPAFGPGGEGP